MKKLLLISISALTFSCGMSPEEKLIADHEQTLGDSKIDLKFDPIETKMLKTITGLDSADILKGWYDSLALRQMEFLSKDFDFYIFEANKAADKISSSSGALTEYLVNLNKKYVNQADSVSTMMEEIEKDHSLGVHESFKQKVKKYEESGAKPLVEIWECRYKIFNPLLQVDQEITKQYVIDIERTKIIHSL